MNPETHVLLVSEQAAANLLPALDPQLKPKQAVLLVSRKMEARAPALEAVLNESGVKTTPVAIEDEHDFHKLQSALLEIAAARQGQAIALNVTGGTKLMTFAAPRRQGQMVQLLMDTCWSKAVTAGKLPGAARCRCCRSR